MKRLCLSFDDGPEPTVTEGVLDVLRHFDVKATFFVIGNKLKRPLARRIIERARSEGHRIGNHTLTHSTPLGRLGAQESRHEIAATQELLGALAPDRLFRPYGAGGHIGKHLLSAAARDYLIEHRFTCVLWNAVPRDWENPEGWVDTAMAQCAAMTHSLVVLHDRATGAMNDLPAFLSRVRSSGTEITQEFPADCLPIISGIPSLELNEYVNS